MEPARGPVRPGRNGAATATESDESREAEKVLREKRENPASKILGSGEKRRGRGWPLI